MQNDAVKEYYDVLCKRPFSLAVKRVFDFLVALVFLVLLSPVIAVIALVIPLDSKGGVFFKQERVTTYCRHFYIYKFRTMVANAEQLGDQLTVSADARVTRVGHVLRRLHLDEIPQLFNILRGEMSFVGTRPEVPKYVDAYTDEMMATLLMPGGITSMASIMYKDEYQLISNASDSGAVYVQEILPQKMRYNLQALKKFSVFSDMAIMFKTFFSVFIKEDANTKTAKTNQALFIVEDARSLILTRKEILLRLLKNGYSVDVYTPIDAHCETLRELGCEVIAAPFDRRSANPVKDLRLLHQYKRLTKKRYDFALTYSVKANIYGGLAMRSKHIPYYCNVTGTGSAFYKGGLLKIIITWLYKPSSRHAAGVFFENENDRDTFVRYKLCKRENTYVFGGAGINTREFEPSAFPHNEMTHFLYVGRLMEEKGIDDLYPVVETYYKNGVKAVFEFVGDFEDTYKESFQKFLRLDNVIYHGYRTNVKDYIAAADCLILPSYHEGMANVLLEAGALARPLIASDIPGCREAVDEGRNGYLFPAKDSEAIKVCLDRFMALSFEEKAAMGERSRSYIEAHFDRNRIVDRIMRILDVKERTELVREISTLGEPAII